MHSVLRLFHSHVARPTTLVCSLLCPSDRDIIPPSILYNSTYEHFISQIISHYFPNLLLYIVVLSLSSYVLSYSYRFAVSKVTYSIFIYTVFFNKYSFYGYHNQLLVTFVFFAVSITLKISIFLTTFWSLSNCVKNHFLVTTTLHPTLTSSAPSSVRSSLALSSTISLVWHLQTSLHLRSARGTLFRYQLALFTSLHCSFHSQFHYVHQDHLAHAPFTSFVHFIHSLRFITLTLLAS